MSPHCHSPAISPELQDLPRCRHARCNMHRLGQIVERHTLRLAVQEELDLLPLEVHTHADDVVDAVLLSVRRRLARVVALSAGASCTTVT